MDDVGPWGALRQAALAVVDIDGVVCCGDEPMEAAGDAVRRIRRAAQEIVFVTNDSRRTKQQQRQRLRAAGVEQADDVPIVTAVESAAAVMREAGLVTAWPLGTKDLEQELAALGVRIGRERPSAVVTGAPDGHLPDAERHAIACIRTGAVWVATNHDRTVPSPHGPRNDTGWLLERLRRHVDQEPLVCGKPFDAMTQAVQSATQVGSGPVVVIGDGLATDIAWAERNRWTSILIAPTDTEERLADHVVPSLAALCEMASDARDRDG